jgi:glucoamylase
MPTLLPPSRIPSFFTTIRSVFFASASIAIFSIFTNPSTKGAVDTYIGTEGPIAKAGLLANIGPNGSKSSGAKPGIVIASPSTSNPNYYYSWTRDSSLVFKTLIDQYTQGVDTSSSLRTLIDDFVIAEATLQQVSNPSGTVGRGGLGEPKFNPDETAFTGPWGRPQRDGPALRSTALIAYANYLLTQEANKTYVNHTLWPIIKLDLDYVSSNWNLTTFDLWEEIESSSFFTTAVQHRSLREGIALADVINQTSVISGYKSQADNLLCFLQSYWNPTGYIIANTGGGRSGIDANTVLASIHTFDPGAGCDAGTFQPCSDRSLSNLLTYVDSFRSIYPINSGIAESDAVATGRYSEDVYQGGNPWYLTTLAVAEQLYDALYVWDTQRSLDITDTSLAFFKVFYSSAAVGTYASNTTTYSTLTSTIRTYADGFVAIVAQYTPSDGALAEQYSKTDGTPLSAVDLTWSYASALTVFNARNGTVPVSWGASGLIVPTTCNTSGIVAIKFNVHATTVFGENIYITGSDDALENWSPEKALILSPTNYPIWSITVNFPASTNIQYKYIRKYNGDVTWESDPNRSLTAPASGTNTEDDTWK